MPTSCWHGIDIEEWMRVQDTRFAPVIQSGRFPHLAKLDNNADVDFDLDTLFEFGLNRLLDGFATLIGLRPAAAQGRDGRG